MKYSKSHEWVEIDGQNARVGITQYAQNELGEVVYAELPQIGKSIKAGDQVVVLESTKAAVDIYTPVSGTITGVNEALKQNPELVNQSPESTGWLFKLRLSKPEEINSLSDIPVN